MDAELHKGKLLGRKEEETDNPTFFKFFIFNPFQRAEFTNTDISHNEINSAGDLAENIEFHEIIF